MRNAPYAVTRLDALRRLRHEGYTPVDKDGFERAMRVLAAAAHLNLRLACNHEDDPECARCELMAPLREALTCYLGVPKNVPIGPLRDGS